MFMTGVYVGSTYTWAGAVEIDLDNAVLIAELEHFIHDFMLGLRFDICQHCQANGSGV